MRVTKRKQTNSNVYQNVEELAKGLGISLANTYEHLKEGSIPHIRLGKRYILPRAAIQEWLKSAGNSLQGES